MITFLKNKIKSFSTISKVGKSQKDFKILPYLKSTGTQYIDTGIKNKTNLKVVIDCEGPFGDEEASFGASEPNDINRFYSARYRISINDSFYFYYSNKAAGYKYCNFKDFSNRHTYVYENNKCYIDNNLKITYTATTFESTNTIFLFWCNYPGSVWKKSQMNLYSCQIYDNEKLVRDYIPVLDSNDIACLYDKVEDKFYYSGGEKFIIPNSKLDYIQSTGTQYIDTGIKADDKTEFEIKYNLTNTNNQFFSPIGSREVEGSTTFNHFLYWHKFQLVTKRYIAFGNEMQEYESLYSHINLDVTASFKDNKLIISSDEGIDSIDITNIESFESTINIWLFCDNTQNQIDSICSMKLYYCKIWKKKELVRDFIPYADSNGIACLYDKVSNQFFYNSGTGNFSMGR